MVDRRRNYWVVWGLCAVFVEIEVLMQGGVLQVGLRHTVEDWGMRNCRTSPYFRHHIVSYSAPIRPPIQIIGRRQCTRIATKCAFLCGCPQPADRRNRGPS